MFKNIIKLLIGSSMVDRIKAFRYAPKRIADPYLTYDAKRFMMFSGAFDDKSREKLLARLIATYHVVEKGLTMPNRRFTFGIGVVRELMALIDRFELQYGRKEPQLLHAIGVVKEYYELHVSNGIEDVDGDHEFFTQVGAFIKKFLEVPTTRQLHTSRLNFYAKRNATFPEFAASRRTVRHYYADRSLPVEKVRAAVELALTTPTACNRQHCRVYCVSDKKMISEILAIQKGSRGFGHLADKLLILTSDLEDLIGVAERNDAYVNGGLFLMNLCYALHWHEIAHCILNWSRTPEEDLSLRQLLPIKDSEVVIAILTCGEAPDEFDIAASPRKKISAVFVDVSSDKEELSFL